MPSNDLISREAAIAAVEAKADRCDQCVCILLTEAHDALAALPADAPRARGPLARGGRRDERDVDQCCCECERVCCRRGWA